MRTASCAAGSLLATLLNYGQVLLASSELDAQGTASQEAIHVVRAWLAMGGLRTCAMRKCNACSHR